MRPKQRRELFMARRELGNVERLLAEANRKLALVTELLDKTSQPESEMD